MKTPRIPLTIRQSQGWLPVVHAAECDADDNCPICHEPYADCRHPGPTQDGFEYREIRGRLLARPRARGTCDASQEA